MTASDDLLPLQNTGDELRALLVAVDSSNGAPRVVSMAARLARAHSAAVVHVVHVFRTSRLERGHAWSSAASADAIEDAKEQLEFHVRAAKAQCRNQVLGHFSVGDPSAEILRLLAEVRADVLVIGTHDLSGFERWLLGSVTETLMRKANCSVFIVRPVGEQNAT